MITRDAEQGQLTVIERNGTKLVLIPAAKLFEIAEQSRRERTVGDILDAYPGVVTASIPRANTRGGPVRQLRLPADDPAS